LELREEDTDCGGGVVTESQSHRTAALDQRAFVAQ
jgi:hypothetical protein